MKEASMSSSGNNETPGVFSKVYGLTMYISSQVAIVLWAMFLSNRGPFRIDVGELADPSVAWSVNIGLVMLFAVQHTIMARESFKRWFASMIPPHLVRSTFVGLTGAILLAITVLWKPMPGIVYQLSGIWANIMWVIYALGWITVIVSTNLIDNLELHGVRQSFKGLKRERTNTMKTPLLYKVVRHPMMLGFLMVLWGTPNMTIGRLLIAVGFTVYIHIGIRFEEIALTKEFAEEYKNYQERVPALFPFFKLPLLGRDNNK
jgi:protein-S-isoprenylcysteine O-methyltransferase Ste14